MSCADRPRVLLADDHEGVLTAVGRLLAHSCEIVGQVTTGAAAIEAATRLDPDVVVLDLTMADASGLVVCATIRQAVPRARVVVLTAADDPQIRRRAFEAGASAFVLKHLVTHELLPAITG
jgi:DNA-binding NarL/FixJ family response regulator